MIEHLKSSYAFSLPDEQIAHAPVSDRESCRLLSLNRENGSIAHHHFYELLDLLPSDGVLVLNDTKVIHARIPIKRKSGAKGEVMIQNKCADGTFTAIVRPSKKIKEGESLICLKNHDVAVQMNTYHGEGLWNVSISPEINFPDGMSDIGELPLPPYIKREHGTTDSDESDYQTVFSENSGSVAAPTASLHFTKELLKKIEDKGIQIVTLTHHVGMGTFYPIRVENVKEHQMHSENYSIPIETSRTISKAKKEGKKIIAVGTTVVRALESTAQKVLNNEDINEATDLFIYPPHQFAIVDALVTNFHLSESSLLMLVSAFADRERVLNAYSVAIKEKYRFFSYGDAMFISS